MYRPTMIALAAVAVMVFAAHAGEQKAKFNNKVKVGDQAPTFKKITGIDDKQHSLDDYKDAKVVVLSFTCNHCPVAVAYEDRFVEFTKQYKDKGVAFVAINVNNLEADKLPAMKERAEKKGFNFDYLYDESQETGRNYGATVTPHMFVLDQKRRIAYMGSFDDKQNTAQVENQYVRDAVEALLAGKQPEVTETRQFGCGIKYETK